MDPECRSLAHRGLVAEVAASRGHDPIDGGKSETGPLTEFLGREEWLEQVRLNVFADAGSGVGHRDHDPTAHWEIAGIVMPNIDDLVARVSMPPDGIASRALTTRFMTTCSNCPLSIRASGDRIESCVQANRAAEQGRESGHNPPITATTSIGPAGAGCLRLKASSWRGQVGCAAAGIADVCGQFVDLAARSGIGQDQLGETIDDSQEVIEVVGNAPRQPPNGFELLRLPVFVLPTASVRSRRG